MKAITTDMCPVCRTNQTWTVEMQQISCFEIKRKTVINKFRLFYHYLKSGHRVPSCNFYTNKPCRVKSCKRFHHRLLHPRANSTVFYEDRDSDCSYLPDLDQINFEDLESGSEELANMLSNQKPSMLIFWCG